MRKRRRKVSLRNYMLIGGIGGSALILILLLSFGSYIMLQYHRANAREHEILTDDYARQLGHDIQSLESYIKNLYVDNVHYQMLKLTNISESQWMLATYYLDNNFSGRADTLNYFGGVYYYDKGRDAFYSAFSPYPYAGDSYRLNQAIKQEMRSYADGQILEKSLMTYEGETYLLYTLGNRGRFLGYTVNLSRYFTLPENMQLILADASGEILIDSGGRILAGEEAAAAIAGQEGPLRFARLAATAEVSGQDLRLMLIYQDNKLSFWNWPVFWLWFILIPVTAFLLLRQTYLFIKRIIYQPIDHFVRRLSERNRGMPEGSGKDPHPVRLEEIRLINEKLDELIAELGRLEQDKYQKEKEANAALLQYYQLQVRPHFFLNCLNIVASLMNENEVETVKKMIYAVSGHFRYVFQDTGSLVTLTEEMAEVQNYCDIYMIQRAVPILLQINIDEASRTERIPILCIQTFVENSIKYVLSTEQVLALSIVADRIRYNDKAYTRIMITDNGDGYQPDLLERLNQPVTGFQYRSEQVGIDNMKYRIFLLYQEAAKIYFYNHLNGGAVTEMLLPAAEEPA